MTVTASGAEVVFTTSGTTGEPVVWLRTVDQLRTEARLVADTVLGPVDAVVTFAPGPTCTATCSARSYPACSA